LTINTTEWRPDTCGCVLYYQWDDTVSDTQRVHTPVNSVKCSDHANQATHSAAFNSVIDENTKKNQGLQTALDNGPTSLFDVQTDGVTRILKNSITYSWTFSGTAPNRVITISFTGISFTNAQRNAIQSKLDTKFGSGKVVLA
jgi:hypothetical protein